MYLLSYILGMRFLYFFELKRWKGFYFFEFFEELEAGGLSDNGVEKLKSDRRWF